MRLRDFMIIILIAGIFAIGLNLMLSDQEVEDAYGSRTAHASEAGFGSILSSINQTAASQAANANTMQGKLSTENEVSLFNIGSVTVDVLKEVLSFSYLNATENVISETADEVGVESSIVKFLFAIIVIVAVFTVVGAILRWRT